MCIRDSHTGCVLPRQCEELLAGGAPGIHFYTLNKARATRAVLGALRVARPWERATLTPVPAPAPTPAGLK